MSYQISPKIDDFSNFGKNDGFLKIWSKLMIFLIQAIPALGLFAHKQVPKPKIIEEIKTILKSVLKDLERPGKFLIYFHGKF